MIDGPIAVEDMHGCGLNGGGSVSRGRISQGSSFCPLFHSKTMVATNASLNCGRHSSVVSSAPTILRPRVRIPSTPSMLFQFVIDF